MSSLLELKGKARKKRKLLGRGNGSGKGTYSGRGGKGQTARTGGNRRPGFEGGQTPLLRKIPKFKGFKNPNYEEYQVVNISQLNMFDDGAEITAEMLKEKSLIRRVTDPIKLLGDGELTKSVTISVNKASKSAIEKVESKKGKVILTVKPKQDV